MELQDYEINNKLFTKSLMKKLKAFFEFIILLRRGGD